MHLAYLLFGTQCTCRYEVPTNLQTFTQKYLTEVKIFQQVLGGLLF